MWFCAHLESCWTCTAIACIASEKYHPSLFQVKMKNIFLLCRATPTDGARMSAVPRLCTVSWPGFTQSGSLSAARLCVFAIAGRRQDTLALEHHCVALKITAAGDGRL